MGEPAAEPKVEPARACDFDEAVRREILSHDRRYCLHAYEFVFEALGHTQRLYQRDPRNTEEERRHVSGRELLEGVRDLALERFGPLAETVLHSWGVFRTEDVGEIVFNLVEHQLLLKTERDTRADFANGYAFADAFRGPIRL